MDDSFKDRVDKVFGSLSSSPSWSLTGGQVERRVWNRDKGDNRDDDETPVSTSFNNLFSCQTNDETENDGDEWEIRSSIGLDATLDNEEEEDAYDKMAEGREDAGDRIYMKDVTDHGPYLNSHNVLPSSLHVVKKDRDAAKTRLKEDDNDDDVSSDEVMLNAEESCVKIKSILKRKSDDAVKPVAKRVRFDSSCKNNVDDGINLQQQGTNVSDTDTRSVPDYILNPSKYTRYSFDDDEESKSVSEEVYLKHVEKSSLSSSSDIPKSVVFIPKKKSEHKQSSSRSQTQPSFAAQQVEISSDEMQQDSIVSTHKSGRRYRTKTEAADEDDAVC